MLDRRSVQKANAKCVMHIDRWLRHCHRA